VALVAVAVGALLLAGGGIAAAVALTHDSNGARTSSGTTTTPSTHTGTTHETTTHTTSTGTTSTTTTTTTTTTGPPPAAGTLAFVPAQSYCQPQAHNQLGFWITLQNTGDKSIDDVTLVASETYGGKAHANPQIHGLKVPANAPKLQTVVSYRLPGGTKVTSCAIRISSSAFNRSGDTLKLSLKR
jgi:hypothetical protein